jgi:outer membrane protein
MFLNTMFQIFISALVIFCTLASQAEDSYNDDNPPYWEYGLGIGTVHFEEYPASGQFRDISLPFPTFQYRGKILRADDRDGAHLYLIKSADWYLEFSGIGYPSLESDKSNARSGMPDLPWILAIGPQVVFKLERSTTLNFAVFQAVSTDFKLTKTNGEVFQLKLNRRFGEGHSYGNIFLTVKAATKEFLATYFDVPDESATAQRPRYDSQSGLLASDLAYFQSFKSGRAAFYVGASYAYYGASANRQSPLHKADSEFTYLVGLTYVLGESSKPEVPEEDTSGLMDRYRSKLLPFF